MFPSNQPDSPLYSPAKPRTIEAYRTLGVSLANRLAPGQSASAAAVAAAFVANAKAGVWAKATVRLYKAALLEHLKQLGASPMVLSPLNILEPVEKVGPKETSSRKLQNISAEDISSLLARLRTGQGKRGTTPRAAQVADLFEATLIFGLRPVEWATAELTTVINKAEVADPNFSATHLLIVNNAKHNASRGNGPVRHIYARITVEQSEVVLRAIQTAFHHQHDWKRHYEHMDNALKWATKKLWPRRKRHPSFYTARHQCIANAKAAQAPPGDMAAIFGHVSDQTARKHYSAKRNGDKNCHMLCASLVSLQSVRAMGLTIRASMDAESELGKH